MRFRTLVLTDVTKEKVLSNNYITERIREAVQFASSQLLKRFVTQRTLPLEIDDARPKLNGASVGKSAIENRFLFPWTVQGQTRNKKAKIELFGRKKVTNPEIYVVFPQNYILI